MLVPTTASIFLLGPAVGVLLVAVLIYLQISKRLIAKVPHPPLWPILGNAYLFMSLTPSEFLLKLKELNGTLGRRFQVALGPDVLLVTSEKKDLEEILSSPQLISKAREYDMLRNWLGDGLLLSTGRKWHSRRKVITPAFHFKILEQFVEVFDQQSDIFVKDVLSKFGANESVDVYPLVTLMALDVICETAMGVRVNAQINSDSEYVKAVKEVARILHIRMFKVMLRYNQLYKFSSLAQTEKKALHILHSFTDSVITRRRKELLAAAKDTMDEDEDLGIKRKMNFIDMLLQTTPNGQPLTNQEIREEVDTFMFEGHDTTTSAISFAMYLFSKHPEIQEKAYQEVIQVIGKEKSEPMSTRTLNGLHYLELCIKEALRLYPSVPLFGRTVTEDTMINGMHLKKGTSVLAGCIFVQQDPEYFADPEEFRPERFLEERSAEKNSPFTYVPFSAGPRNCIGQKFAMYEMKSALSKILLHYKLTEDKSYKGPTLVAELILKPENGVPVKLARRT